MCTNLHFPKLNIRQFDEVILQMFLVPLSFIFQNTFEKAAKVNTLFGVSLLGLSPKCSQLVEMWSISCSCAAPAVIAVPQMNVMNNVNTD